MNTQTASTSERPSEIQMGKRIMELEDELATLRRAAGLVQYHQEFYERYGFKEKDVIERLAGCTETNHVWEAVQLALRQAITDEHMSARHPDLTNEAMRTNVAREASLEDFRNKLANLWARANKPIKG